MATNEEKFLSAASAIEELHYQQDNTSVPRVQVVDATGQLFESWQCGNPYKHAIKEPEGDRWEILIKQMKAHDSDMCDAWKDEIQNLLIFAGLFSAVVTTFVAESYKLLQEDPSDTTARLLTLAVAQLHNLNTNNIPAPSITTNSANPFIAPAFAIRVNIIWFVSLTLSLSTVALGILCMQWLRAYQRYPTIAPQEAVGLRQMRYQGLMKWRVPAIVTGLPLLLQGGLILFFAGLIDFLWTLHKTVALVVGSVAGLAFLFLAVTTILPTVQYILVPNQHLHGTSQCPYKSPQSLISHWIGLNLLYVLKLIKTAYHRISRQTEQYGWLERLLRLANASHWSKLDIEWQKLRNRHTKYSDVARGVVWLGERFASDVDSNGFQAVCRCLHDFEPNLMRQALGESGPRKIRIKDIVPKGLIYSERDLIRATALQRFLDGTKKFLPHRLELYIRLKNSYQDDAKNVPCPLVASQGLCVPVEAIAEDAELRIQGANCLGMLIRHNAFGADDISSAFHFLDVITNNQAVSDEAADPKELDAMHSLFESLAFHFLERRDHLHLQEYYHSLTRLHTKHRDRFLQRVSRTTAASLVRGLDGLMYQKRILHHSTRSSSDRDMSAIIKQEWEDLLQDLGCNRVSAHKLSPSGQLFGWPLHLTKSNGTHASRRVNAEP